LVDRSTTSSGTTNAPLSRVADPTLETS